MHDSTIFPTDSQVTLRDYINYVNILSCGFALLSLSLSLAIYISVYLIPIIFTNLRHFIYSKITTNEVIEPARWDIKRALCHMLISDRVIDYTTSCFVLAGAVINFWLFMLVIGLFIDVPDHYAPGQFQLASAGDTFGARCWGLAIALAIPCVLLPLTGLLLWLSWQKMYVAPQPGFWRSLRMRQTIRAEERGPPASLYTIAVALKTRVGRWISAT